MTSRWQTPALAAAAALLLGGGWLLTRPQAPAPLPPPRPAAQPVRPALWTQPQLQDLLAAVEQADAEGLRAADYDVDALRAAAAGGHPADALADRAALALAYDFGAGRIRNPRRFNWYIDHPTPAPADVARQITAARAQGKLKEWLDGLLPTAPAYRALRGALASTPADDTVRRDRIRANMERWRWLPRDWGGGDQLYVNLPTYRLDVVEGGRTTASYRTVIGALDMQTPALSVPVRRVIANPDWIVPQSIVRRSHLRPGASSRYIFTTRPDGTLRVRQKPGPGNALGQVKIVFPNPLAIYFHDTPSRSLFGASTRAFSHGCVRVQNIAALAQSLVADPDRFTAALAGTQTRGFTPAHAWQAVIVYLTLVPGEAGGLVDVGDPYGQDAPLAAALDGRKRPAPTPATPAAPAQPPAPTPTPAPAPAPAPLATPPRPAPASDPDAAIVNTVAAPESAPSANETPPGAPPEN